MGQSWVLGTERRGRAASPDIVLLRFPQSRVSIWEPRSCGRQTERLEQLDTKSQNGSRQNVRAPGGEAGRPTAARQEIETYRRF